MYRIEAELLIPGHDDPIRDGVVLLDGAEIGYAGRAAVAPPTPGASVTRAVTVMPGMWECHGHLLGTRTFPAGQGRGGWGGASRIGRLSSISSCSGMPYSPTLGISGLSRRDRSTAPGRSSASRNPRRW